MKTLLLPFATRLLPLAGLLLCLPAPVFAQTTPIPPIMNFQGRLAKPDGTPVPDSKYQITFSIFAASSGGTALWTQTMNSVPVQNGVFAVLLGNGNPLTADMLNGAPYLQIQVGSDNPLPRQQFASVAFAFKANTVPDGAITAAKLAAGAVTNAAITSVDASKITNTTVLPFWQTTGNAGTVPGVNFLGTTDAQPLEFRVNNSRVFYAVSSTDTSIPASGNNVIGGYEMNSVSPNVTGATVWGGYFDGNRFLPNPNQVTGSGGTVSGGAGSTAASNAVVGGGVYHNASGYAATIAGGFNNGAAGDYSTLGGGVYNYVSGLRATIPGGFNNRASGLDSFAAGSQAQAGHDGAFVWSDTSNSATFGKYFSSTGPNQFLISAAGGVGINTNDPAGFALNVSGTAKISGNLTVNSTTYTSDARYKTNILTINNALNDVLALRGVSYDWDKAKWPEKNFSDSRQYGFIAQELEKVFPNLVQTDAQGYKSVNYVGVIPVLVEGMKAQEKRIRALEADNAELKAQVREIEELKKQNDRVTTLEKQLAELAAMMQKMQDANARK